MFDNFSDDLNNISLGKLDKDTSSDVRVRFAPSPTGQLHIGGLRTALYNYLFAKKHNGTFVIRIEDTDQKRLVPTAEKYIQDSLDWVGIIPDESPWVGGQYGPYRQSERDYTQYIKILIDKGLAYYAFDTEQDLENARSKDSRFSYGPSTRNNMVNSLTMSKEELDKRLSNGDDYVVRFLMTPDKTVTFNDIIRGSISFNTNLLDDKVLIKSNGIPTYHFANICDDHNMKISHVIRGEEWLNSTPLHVLLYQAFDWTPPLFAHLPLLLNPDGRGKLSKRKAAQYGFPVFPLEWDNTDDSGNFLGKAQGFKEQGYESDAFLNFLVLLGWNPGDDTEIMSLDDMIRNFSLDNVSKSGAKFDIEKAKWFNSIYIRGKSNDELSKYLDKGDGSHEYNDKDLSRIVDLSKVRSVFVNDLNDTAKIFFYPVSGDKSKLTDEFVKVFTEFVDTSVDWKVDNIKQTIYDISAKDGIKMNKLMPILRMAVAGGLQGPDLMTTMEILGEKESKLRISNFIN